jgi:hypothetical protein
MYTLEDCSEIWVAAGKHGTPEERIARSKKWMPYYDYLADKIQAKEPVLTDEPSPFVERLLRENVITDQYTLFDIGAGMGGYDLEFARHCKHITAMEPNSACLKVLRNNAEKLGLSNIETVQTAWEDFNPDRQYDVTFSSMCPAICNVDELRRMETMTRRSCCLITVTRGSYDKHRKAMMAELNIKPQGGMVTEAIHYINALYLMGRQPNVKCVTTHRTSRVSVERVMEQYPIYFRIFGVPERESEAFLKDYLAHHAQNGYLEDESLLKQALIYWNVSE